MRERGEKILVDRPALAVALLLLIHLGDQPRALLDGIGQLAKSVRQLDAARIKLEPLRDARIVRARRAKAASLIGYSVSSVSAPSPRLGSTCCTNAAENASLSDGIGTGAELARNASRTRQIRSAAVNGSQLRSRHRSIAAFAARAATRAISTQSSIICFDMARWRGTIPSS